MKTRTSFTVAGIIASLLLIFSSVTAAEIDPDSGDGYVKVNRKIHCSLNDEEPVTYVWSGRAYTRVPGERDKHLFNLLGMNIRQCTTLEDKDKGTGYRMVSREIMLYLDPETNKVMKTWDNPWSGETVDVIHVANDPVNGRPTFGVDAKGKQRSIDLKPINGTWMLNFEVPLFYHNVLAGDYQKYVGGTYHATEIFDFNGDMDELLDSDKTIAYPIVSWVRISQFLPWMEMGGRAGNMYFNAVGKKLESFDQLPGLMKAEIAANYPAYSAPPPVDDTRKNETSWTYMKKMIDSRPKDEEAKKGH